MDIIAEIFTITVGTVRDVLPIAAIIFGFQFFVLRKKPANLGKILMGFVWVLIGLSLFLLGLEWALFPLGKLMAAQLTDPGFIHAATGGIAPETGVLWQDYYWVYIFAFLIGFSTTIAEPSLIAVAIKANEVSGGRDWNLGLANSSSHRSCSRYISWLLPDCSRRPDSVVHHQRLCDCGYTDLIRTETYCAAGI